MSAPVSLRRWTRSRPCPVCGGWQTLPQGRGVRCYGYLADGGRFARCSREERAGAIAPGPDALYPHRLDGPCRCGATHERVGAPVPTASREAAPRPEPVVLGDLTDAQLAALAADRRMRDPATAKHMGLQRIAYYGRGWIGIPTLAGGWKLWGVESNGALRRTSGGRLERRNAGPASLVVSPDLRAAASGSSAVLTDVEGESDLIAAVEWYARHGRPFYGIAGTAGAKSVHGHERHRGFLLGLRPSRVRVIRDLDDAGREGAEAARAWWRRQGVPAEIKVLPEAVGPGGDVRDYLLNIVEPAEVRR